MLTADLVRVRRKGGFLTVPPMAAEDRRLAEAIGARYIELTSACVGVTRAEWERECASVQVRARSRKIAAGLRKLIEDRCVFEMDEGIDPIELRAAVFELAAKRRSELAAVELLDRDALLSEAAETLGMTAEAVDARLFGDLSSARRLQSFAELTAPELLARYERGCSQAVLLRATRVEVELLGATAPALRRLFAKLKFLRLLFVLAKTDRKTHRLEVDGPLALFGPSTKYGLQLALLVNVLDATGPYTLEADVQWGPNREPLRFRLDRSDHRAEVAGSDTTRSDELDALRTRINKKKSGWRIRRNTRVLDLPGIGLCVPDLVFVRDGTRVYLEVMGYWSRDAVWRRVELVEAGLKERILFCVSSRLRVSEAALGDDVPGSLYVFKGVMSAPRVLEKIEELASTSCGPDGGVPSVDMEPA